MVIDGIKFNKLDQPLCPRCGEIIRKLAVLIKIPSSEGSLYGVTCTRCGGKMLGRDEKEDENDT